MSELPCSARARAHQLGGVVGSVCRRRASPREADERRAAEGAVGWEVGWEVGETICEWNVSGSEVVGQRGGPTEARN
jgi:hypothetical protein